MEACSPRIELEVPDCPVERTGFRDRSLERERLRQTGWGTEEVFLAIPECRDLQGLC